ncbi:MAG: hypothetical protein Q8R82_07120 [Hyphomonadaceae bacterium]|nr:hypothetical protein [Hyphomonadaceae bacterium]
MNATKGGYQQPNDYPAHTQEWALRQLANVGLPGGASSAELSAFAAAADQLQAALRTFDQTFVDHGPAMIAAVLVDHVGAGYVLDCGYCFDILQIARAECGSDRGEIPDGPHARTPGSVEDLTFLLDSGQFDNLDLCHAAFAAGLEGPTEIAKATGVKVTVVSGCLHWIRKANGDLAEARRLRNERARVRPGTPASGE